MTAHKGQQFSTWDQDHDADDSVNCAERYHGAWWYKACHRSNLNGQYLDRDNHNNTEAKGIVWKDFKGHNYSLRKVEMMMRPEE